MKIELVLAEYYHESVPEFLSGDEKADARIIPYSAKDVFINTDVPAFPVELSIDKETQTINFVIRHNVLFVDQYVNYDVEVSMDMTDFVRFGLEIGCESRRIRITTEEYDGFKLLVQNLKYREIDSYRAVYKVKK